MPQGTGARRRMIGIAAVAVIAAGGVAASRPAEAATGDPYASLSGTVWLTSDVLAGLGNAALHGQRAAASTLSIGVALARPDPAGENAYLADVYNPASPNFRHFLTPAGFQARFGVAEARFQAAISWLQHGGLTVTAIPGSSEYVLAAGRTSAVEALFQVTIADYTFKGTSFYANTAAPAVPARLGILDVAGLQSYEHMRTLQQIHAAAVASGKEPAGIAGPALPGPGTNIGSTTPQDLWSIYDQPSDNFGQGESMAIFGDGCTEPSDGSACSGVDLIGNLRKDEATYQLPQMPIIITHYGTASEPINDTSGVGEWELDMPASTGMAPHADFEHLYFGNNGQDPDNLAAYSAWDSDQNGPHQGSSSFAGCEATPATGDLPGGPENPTPGPGGEIIGNPNQDAYEALLKEAVELGRTMFNSAGDLGANGCPQNVNTSLNGVTPTETGINNYPSSSDWVTTVGGTVLYWNGDGDSGPTPATRALEYSWAYSGGGTSFYISAPPWQQGMGFDTDATSAPGVTWPCTTNWETPSPGPPVEPAPYPAGTFCRGLPDVDAQSGDVISNGYFAGGGTSLSSPLWLGMWTRIQAAAPVPKDPEGLGFASRAIYANNANASNYERDFFDIGGVSPAYDPGTTNTNTVVSCDPQPGPYSCSGSGWDYASGWGTPKVTALMQDLDGGTVPTHPSGPAANTPEAPVSALLVLLGAAVVGVRPARARWLRRGAQRRSPPGPGTATAR